MKSWIITPVLGALALGLSAPTCSFAAPKSKPVPTPSGTVYVANYGTSTADVQRALSAAAGKTLVFPANHTYTITSILNVPSNIVIQGNGSILKTPDNSTSSTTSDTLLDINGDTNVNVSGLKFDGNVGAQTNWSQWRHAIRVSGSASNVTLNSLTFNGLIGDGVYIGAGNPSSVTVSNSTFTGDHKNRNGVSIISGRTVSITNNSFTKMARTDMPGAVDVEPNSSSNIVSNVTISNNVIVGGPRLIDKYQYAITVNNHADATLSTIKVLNNDVSGAFYTGAGIIFINQPTPSKATGLLADGNNVHDLTLDRSTGIELDYGMTAAATNNKITNVGWGIQSWKACLTNSSGNIYTNTPNGGLTVTESTCA